MQSKVTQIDSSEFKGNGEMFSKSIIKTHNITLL